MTTAPGTTGPGSTSAAAAAAAARRRARARRRPIPMIIGTAVVIGAAWWGWVATHPRENPLAGVITATAARGDLDETVTATGSVTAQIGQEVKIGSQITGVIKRLYADIGSHLRAGQVIADLDLPDIKAQYDQSAANLQAARTKLAQTISGVGEERVQTSRAIVEAQAAVNSSRAKLVESQEDATQQPTTTSTDIDKARTNLAAMTAALQTARASEAQTVASVNLQVATAKEQLKQAQANFANTDVQLKRDITLDQKGFVADSVVDQARATNIVNQSLIDAAQENLGLVQEQVKANLETAHDQVTQAQQNVAAAGAALRAAQSEVAQNYLKEAAVRDSQAQVGQSSAALDTAVANKANDILKDQDVEQAREAELAAEDQVRYAKAQYDKTFISSPIDGTVLQLAAQQGETLAAGLSAPTLIVVCNLDRLQVDVFVDETDIGKIRLNQAADVVVDAFPKHTFHGKVTKIYAGSTIQQGVVTYDVTISVPTKGRRLKPDMTATATIHTGKVSDALLVPAEAVHLGTRGYTVDVLTTDKTGTPSVNHVKVKTGATDGVNTQVTQGLTDGQTVVLAGDLGGGQNGQTHGPQSPFGPQQKKASSGGHRL